MQDNIRFLHIGDIHLGREFNTENLLGLDSNQRREELWHTFENSLVFAVKNDVDILLISGDLFENDNVTVSDMDRLIYIFEKFNSLKIFLVFGNHDHLGVKTEYLKNNRPTNLYLFNNELGYYELGNTRIYGFSWEKMEYDYFPVYMEELDSNYINILLLHGTNMGKTNYLPTPLREIEGYGFDYIALGHIHDPIQVGERAFYPGSLEPLSFGELGLRGGILGDLSKSNFNYKYVNLSKRQYKILDLEIDESFETFQLFKEIENILKLEENNFLRINIIGNRSVNLDLDEVIILISNKYNLVDLIDGTDLFYDIKNIIRDNEDNIIGEYFKFVLKNYDNENRDALIQFGIDGFLLGDNFEN